MQHRVEVTAAAGLEASWLSRLAQSLGGGSNSSKERLLSKAAPHKHTAGKGSETVVIYQHNTHQERLRWLNTDMDPTVGLSDRCQVQQHRALE